MLKFERPLLILNQIRPGLGLKLLNWPAKPA